MIKMRTIGGLFFILAAIELLFEPFALLFGFTFFQIAFVLLFVGRMVYNLIHWRIWRMMIDCFLLAAWIGKGISISMLSLAFLGIGLSFLLSPGQHHARQSSASSFSSQNAYRYTDGPVSDTEDKKDV